MVCWDTVVWTCSLPWGTTRAILIAGHAWAVVTHGLAAFPITCCIGDIVGGVMVSLESDTVAVDSEP